MKKILFLWSDFTGYMQRIASTLTQEGHEVCIAYWSYTGSDHELNNCGLNVKSKNLNLSEILGLIQSFDPDLVVVCGWMDLRYVYALIKLKALGFKFQIVTGFDDQWHGRIRQFIGSFVYKLTLKYFFDYAWISGRRQYMFARKLGYTDNKIINNLYCGQFSYYKRMNSIGKKRLIYVGRLIKSKGIHLLVSAHKKMPLEIRAKWPLFVIGEGPLSHLLNNDPYIIYMGKLSRDELFDFLLEGGIGCVPSLVEQWGVVIHEYTQLGMPIICSKACGAASDLIIDDYNGYTFINGCVDSLSASLINITGKSQIDLLKLSHASTFVSSSFSLDKSVKSLLSII
jgi:glycosyltransferase involved in cell wall biosynthesis